MTMTRWTGFAFFMVAVTQPLWAQHYHLHAGASAPVAGTQLLFTDGDNYNTNSGFVVKMEKNATNGFNGEYVGNISMAALSADPLAPEPGHAAPGTFIEVEIVSLDGPEGGAISFWDENNVHPETGVRIFSVPTGTRNGTNRIELSEGDGSPGSDPYGHIHRRNFSATVAGLYTVGMRILDSSKNGPDGGPLHEASEVFPIYFQAGITLGLRIVDGTVRVRYPAPIGRRWALERSASPGEEWVTVVESSLGDDHLHEYEAPMSTVGFYRVRGE